MKYLQPCLILILLGCTIYLCFRNYHLRQRQLPERVITDTIYLSRKWEPIKPYKFELMPRNLIFYGVRKKEEKDLSYSYDSIDYKVGSKDSLVQFTLEKDKLTLSNITSTGNYYTREYPIDLGKYDYNWYNNQLTRNPTPHKFFHSLNPYAQLSYRPFNNLFDIGIGISFKTNRINYKLGVNGFYYPRFQKNLGWDLELSINYEF